MSQLSLKALTEPLPPVRRTPKARAQIRKLNRSMEQKLVVLDDDPTGCQTVHDVDVLTTWEDQLLSHAVHESDCFYILTNCRAVTEQEAIRIDHDVIQALVTKVSPPRLRIVSRSDSTLRGHFAAEMRVLLDMLGPFDGVLVVPYFREGGRLTVNDTHYVLQDDTLVPAHETESARDPVFGFAHSHLPTYIEEKSGGLWTRADVTSITVEDIRRGGPEGVRDRLLSIGGARPVIVNALCDEDLETAVLGLCRAEAAGKRFLYRTAASFVKIRAGMPDVPLYEPLRRFTKGLVVVGSYVDRTTRQLQQFMDKADPVRAEVALADVTGDRASERRQEIIRTIDAALGREQSAVLYTERRYALTGAQAERLDAGRRISDLLCQVVAGLRDKPDFIVAKGGITACEVARSGLSVKRARVLGQLVPGVPLWQLGPESKHPGLLYVVFPGNVGNDESLYEAYARLV